METYRINLTLLSDATFGRGDGVAGLVDTEVEHDEYGLPYLRGRTLKGLLREECANILFALDQHAPGHAEHWQDAAQTLFGQPGSSLDDGAGAHIGDARLPGDLTTAIVSEIDSRQASFKPTDVLDSLTAIRRQTAMDPTGKPERGSLRAMRVILRDTPFQAELSFRQPPDATTLALLAACARALRRAGTGRNRGRGRICARLCDAQGNDITDRYFQSFRKEVGS